jgi:uncharacterized protein with HEPN domain
MTPRTDLAPVSDMLDAAERALRHAAGLGRDALVADEMRSDAVLHVLTVFGEASVRVSEATRERFPDIPWRQIRGMRNVLVHRYDWVDWDIVWNVLAAHLRPTADALRAMRATLEAEEPPPPEATP